jgi:hypothetical protein
MTQQCNTSKRQSLKNDCQCSEIALCATTYGISQMHTQCVAEKVTWCAMSEFENTKLRGKQDSFGSSVVKNMIAGGVARSVSAISLHPIDLAKTRMQFQSRNLNHGVYYRNGAHAIWHTLSTEGPFALYRGLLIRLIYVVPSAAVNFTVYDQFKRSLVGQGSWNHVGGAVILGSLARVVQTGIRTPFDIIKQQLQVQGRSVSVMSKTGLPIVACWSVSCCRNGKQ